MSVRWTASLLCKQTQVIYIFSRLLYGARASLSLGFLATIISTVIGMFIGSIVGYFGGIVDKAQTSLYQHAILVRNPVRRLQQGK